MVEHYPSIGEAVAAAMRHNINLAHRPPGRTLPAPETPARLTAAASPGEAAAVLEAVTRPLAQASALAATAGDWARHRADVDDPAAPAYQVWQHLVAAAQRLSEARTEVDRALDKIGDCPAGPLGAHTDAVCRPHDVPGCGPEEDRRRAARAASPHAAAPAEDPPAAPPAAPPRGPESAQQQPRPR